MRLTPSVVFAATLIASTALAETPTLPADAVQLKGAEIGSYLDGKRFSVVIYDAEVSIKATINWDLARGLVYGDYVANGTKGKFENQWIIKGNTSCGEKTAKGTWVCQKIFVSGDTMYEVNKAGGVHAVSKLK